MSFWDKVKAFLASEAKDVKEGIDAVRDKLDAELTKRERELEASPSERIEMMKEEMDATDNVFDRIEADIDSRLDPDAESD